MKNSRYIHHLPDKRALHSSTIWTADGEKLFGILDVLFKLKVISMDHFR